LKRGLAEASGDLVVLAEPDGTFRSEDVKTLLELSGDFEMVCGSRTNTAMIASDARMGPGIRIGNIVVARLLSALFATVPFSDCGCTLRLVRRHALRRFISSLSVNGSHFLPDMVIQAKLHGVTMTEVPVAYGKRVGQSKITGSLKGAVTTGSRMVALILWRRFSNGRLATGRAALSLAPEEQPPADE
jgi:hypothetical protein